MNELDWFIKCPVPRDQRPFYEYLRRKQSTILGWVGLNQIKYAKRFFTTLLVLFTFFIPVTSLTFSYAYYPVQSLLFNILLSLVALGLIYGYFFVAWYYAGQRLLEAKVLYEESGWYDGKIWVKPPIILKHERLLYHYQLVPLIKRLKNTLKIIFIAIILIFLLLFFLFY